MAHTSLELIASHEDFDENGYFRGDRLLQYFQDVAGNQIDALGYGSADIIKDGLIWVIAKMKLEIREQIKEGDSYIFTTFPHKQKRTTFMRGYYVNKSEDGVDPDKAIIAAYSQWTILDIESRKPARTNMDFDIPNDEIDILPGPFAKIHSSELKHIGDYTVCEEDIDFNNHTNNSRYLYLAHKFSGKSFTEKFNAAFSAESMLGDKLSLYSEEKEEGTLVEIRNADDAVVFQVVF